MAVASVSDWAPGFDGLWQDPTGAVLSIAGGTVTRAEGRPQELHIQNETTCTFRRGSNVYEGRLSEDRNSLLWPCGTAWVRKTAGLHKSSLLWGTANKRPDFTLEKALSLQKELIRAFSDPELQSELAELAMAHSGEPERLAAERSKLLLGVQGEVLPRYGFRASQEGIIDMLDAGSRFNKRSEYQQNRDALNRLLGLVDFNCGVQVLARHVFDGSDLTLVLPRHSTFGDLKQAIAKQVGRDDVLHRGHLVKKENGVYSAYSDEDPVGEVRQVFVFRASLCPH